MSKSEELTAPESGSSPYSQGTDIHVAPGQENHLPHKPWHVIQQAQGHVEPTKQVNDAATVNDDAALERVADTMGENAIKIALQKTGRQACDAPPDARQKTVKETELR